MGTINKAMPNFVNICIDDRKDDELIGKFYHKYSKEPVYFEHFMALVKQMEHLMDEINYPQTTTHKRSFIKEERLYWRKKEVPEKYHAWEFDEERGKKATFYVCVKGRAHATWQGEIFWVEEGITKKFRSELELMILMDRAIK